MAPSVLFGQWHEEDRDRHRGAADQEQHDHEQRGQHQPSLAPIGRVDLLCGGRGCCGFNSHAETSRWATAFSIAIIRGLPFGKHRNGRGFPVRPRFVTIHGV
jgi:hypothetical protein